jgi:two-component system, sensor histidine kinase RpfC
MAAPSEGKQPGNILVIDDDRSARMLLERVLTRAGHRVLLVDTAEEGLDKLKAEPFDLLVTDKNLPGLDGLEVLKQARVVRPRLRALLITGFPTPETKSAASDLGVHAYVTKPFGVHDILDICEAAIRASREAPA